MAQFNIYPKLGTWSSMSYMLSHILFVDYLSVKSDVSMHLYIMLYNMIYPKYIICM